MNILSIHKYYWDRDGASRYQLEVNRLLAERGHAVAPFAMQDPHNLPSPWAKYFAPPMDTHAAQFTGEGARAFGRMLYNWKARDGVKRLADEFHAEVAHVHNIYTQLSPSVLDALRDAHVPAVMTVHDYHMLSPNYMQWRAPHERFHKNSFAAHLAQATVFHTHRFLRLYDRGIATFVCPSRFVLEQMREAGFAPTKLVHLPHFVETKNVPISSRGDGSVLFVSRLVEEKGTRFVVELARAMPDVKFVIAGDGPLLPFIKGTASKNCEVTGWLLREELAAWYLAASVVIVPSLWPEVFGLTALEAMAHGKAVLVSDQGGLPEVVEDGVSGRVVSAGNVDAWKKTIEILLQDPLSAETYGRAARLRAEMVFSPEKHIDRLLEIFKKTQNGVRS
ncbi:glycosyltransferase family 4 protein [Candidatus Uhrbacteria bacterium]|nr:glycosyltransferase family 4 protein [Candidatus Uhrbacteria bacterium]